MSNEKAAQRIVKAIVIDLSDRRGLRHGWESIDEDIQQEIVKKWTAIVLKGITAEVAALKKENFILDDVLTGQTERIAELKAEIARRDAPVTDAEWQPIAPENLPKVGDEVLRHTRGILDQMKSGGAYVVHSVTALYGWDETTAQEFADGGWTHFRPINPPTVARATPPQA